MKNLIAAFVLWLGVSCAAVADPPAYSLVIYTADWCVPCQKLKADIANHPEMLLGIPVEWRDVSELGPINATIPDIRLFRGDEGVARVVGYRGRRPLTKWLKEWTQ